MFGSSGFVSGPQDSWARGLSSAQAAEWFVDCFRMRMDDDQVWCGAEHHGYYFASAFEKMREFLIFCNLAVDNGVVPSTLSWDVVLKKAEDLILYAFEKSDAQEKYGQENVFAALTGGRSLRASAMSVYGFGINGEPQSTQFKNAMANYPNVESTLFRTKAYFGRVGGMDKWEKLLAAMKRATEE
ncbi:hypothetical protein BCR44DRAFT_1457052 [Catenaria anguillulae PL171]|uniref:Uncharacterized protein n=1 Tax=Catenaria anguillulae PL171 TaxID=765915 RepID=A0A1Y2I595_9FUNG|nr:hypothetical protein BCR44DRAFT_1457052 [Catenaria anguillulae PL171]